MNVLMLSGDRHVLEAGSPAAERLALQRQQVDVLDVFVWPQMHRIREMLCAVRTKHYEVVTAQDPFWRGLVAWGVARYAHARLQVQVHTDLIGQSLFRRFLARFVLRRADIVRVVSNRLRQYVAAGGVRVPIHVLPIYVDLASFRGIEHHPHSHFTKVILWVGRFEHEKNPHEAVRILAEVRAAHIDAGLILLGAGSLESDLRDDIQRRGLDAYVELPGWGDPRPYLAMADVVVSTSPHESYGASIVEALAAGVPVVAPDVGVAKEVGAVIVPREELAKGVIEVLRSGDRGKLIGTFLTASEWVKKWRETLT